MDRTLTGRGTVYEEGCWLADVTYHLTIEGGEILESDVLGRVEVVAGERDLLFNHTHPLTLRLEDGRALKFYVARADLSEAIYQVRAGGAQIER
jgi:hypothetical protein